MRIRSHPVGLDVWFLVEPFVYFQMSRFAWAFAGRLCDKYHNLIAGSNMIDTCVSLVLGSSFVLLSSF